MDEPESRGALRSRRIPERWKAPLFDLALLVVLGGLTLAELSGAPSHSTAAEGTAALLALAIGLQRRYPHTALTAVTAYAAVQALLTGLGVTSTTILVVPYLCVSVSAFRAGLFSHRSRPVVALTAVTAAATLAVYAAAGMVLGYDTRAFLSSTDDWASIALALVLTLVTPWLFGRYWHWQNRVGHGGWEMAERMERTRAAETDRARLLERARIASRMHDSLGHDLALIAVRAAALEMAAQEDPERREAAAELRGAAHEASLRLREVIGFLREKPEDPPTETVSDLVERASDAGLSVRLLREGPDPDPGSVSGRSAHRVVQEALTNAAKYAPGAEVSVRVVRGDGVTRVTVEDTGTVTGSTVPSRPEDTGGGLAGLRALAEKEGGTFESGPSGSGFALRAVLPETHGSPDSADTATRAHQLRAQTRGRARRSLITAVVVPSALGMATVGVAFLALWWVSANSVLPPERYELLSVGDPRATVEAELPRYSYPASSVDDPPPPPAEADECRYFLVTMEGGLPPVYRLCFADGVLVSKEGIERTQ